MEGGALGASVLARVCPERFVLKSSKSGKKTTIRFIVLLRRFLWINAGLHSYEIPIYIERAVEHTQDINTAIWFYQIGNSVMTVEKNTNRTKAFGFIPVTDFRMLFE